MEYANPQQRFHWKYAEGEIEHLARLTGLERVKLQICTVKDLLPDDDARIFTQVCYLLNVPVTFNFICMCKHYHFFCFLCFLLVGW